MGVESVVSQMGLGALPPVYFPGTYNAKLLPYKEYYPAEGVLHAYLWWAAEVAYSTPLYHIGTLLPVICHEATRRGYKLETVEKHLRIWTCLLGGSGSGKSTCQGMGRDFYDDFRKMEAGTGTYLTPFVQLGGSIQGIKKLLATEYKDPAQGRVMGILENDEVTRFFQKTGASVTEDLCQMFDGRVIADHTRTAQREAQLAGLRPTPLEDYTVQGLFATTPNALDESTTEGYFTGGLFPRMFWVNGKVDPKDWTPGLINWQKIRRGTALAVWQDWATNVSGYDALPGAQKLIRVRPEAQALYDAFADRYKTRCFDLDGGRVPPMVIRGITDHIWNIAAAYAFSNDYSFDMVNLTGCWIHEADMAGAIHMVESCFQTFNKLAVTVAVEVGSKIEDKILALLTAAGPKGMTTTDLMMEFSNNRQRAQQALSVLYAGGQVHGVIPKVADASKHSNPQGKPKTYFFLTSLPDPVPGILAAWEREHGYPEGTAMGVGYKPTKSTKTTTAAPTTTATPAAQTTPAPTQQSLPL